MSDDGLPWGYLHLVEGWLELPKGPGLIDLGPPPFSVTLLDGRVRHVVHKPETTEGAEDAVQTTAAAPPPVDPDTA